MIQHIIGRFKTFSDACKFLNSKELIKFLNDNLIELVGNFVFHIIHDGDSLDYTVVLELGGLH